MALIMKRMIEMQTIKMKIELLFNKYRLLSCRVMNNSKGSLKLANAKWNLNKRILKYKVYKPYKTVRLNLIKQR